MSIHRSLLLLVISVRLVSFATAIAFSAFTFGWLLRPSLRQFPGNRDIVMGGTAGKPGYKTDSSICLVWCLLFFVFVFNRTIDRITDNAVLVHFKSPLIESSLVSRLTSD